MEQEPDLDQAKDLEEYVVNNFDTPLGNGHWKKPLTEVIDKTSPKAKLIEKNKRKRWTSVS